MSKKASRSLAFLLAAVLMGAAALSAAATKTYQVTGLVLEVSADMIEVQKVKDRCDIARDSTTKITGELKVGTKVKIEYRMTATSVDVKAAKAAAKKK